MRTLGLLSAVLTAGMALAQAPAPPPPPPPRASLPLPYGVVVDSVKVSVLL
jgi:hypothetical protein